MIKGHINMEFKENGVQMDVNVGITNKGPSMLIAVDCMCQALELDAQERMIVGMYLMNNEKPAGIAKASGDDKSTAVSVELPNTDTGRKIAEALMKDL